jgi:predicted AAA+ superfamily ATPase
MYFKRDLSTALMRYKKFPVVAILGPRQSGKTTLAQHFFNQHKFVTLEHPDSRLFAKTDPERFLYEFENPHGIIIDEFQYVPELLHYIQIEVDQKKRPGYFVLTGSQNFTQVRRSSVRQRKLKSNDYDVGGLNQAITQSLAGRVGILTLLPMSIHEQLENKLFLDLDTLMFKGAYPRIYSDDLLPLDFYPSYIKTYIERDVRDLAHVGDILIFQKFMRMCAAHIGQALKIDNLATNLGVDQRTVNQWIAVLEASYILYQLKPYHNNYNKRLTKTPKIYFYDTGLACSLLDIKSRDALALSPFRGNIFESFMITDFYKQYYNIGLQPSLYFWRDQNGRLEVDCVIDKGNEVIPVEIKSGQTFSSSFFSAINEWSKLADVDLEKNNVVYGGDLNQQRSNGAIIGWQEASTFIARMYEGVIGL